MCVYTRSIQVVYEYVGSRTLARLLLDETQGALLPLARQILLIAQVSNALAYCHKQRLVHLDVKPHNVLLVDTAPTGRDWCKLADFGCSRRIAGIDEGAALKVCACTCADACISGATGGTLVYTAPEVLQTAVATRKADVYSLALTAWQVCMHVRFVHL
jgi:proto-oncogene serine/threonine-protein kinase mos